MFGEGGDLRDRIVNAAVLIQGDTVETSGSIEIGPTVNVWLDRGFGLTGRVEGGSVRAESLATDLAPGEAGSFLAEWSDGSLHQVRRATAPAKAPVVLHADESLPTRTDLRESDLRAVTRVVADVASEVMLASGGYGSRLTVSLAYVTPAIAQWWSAYRTVQVDLVVSIVPTRFWTTLGDDVCRIVGRPGVDPANPFELSYEPD